MDRLFLSIGALSACVSVAAGAFGAHALRDRVSADRLSTWQSAAAYEMYHALALIAVGLLLARVSSQPSPLLPVAGWLFLAGTILFCGSLYALSLTGITLLGVLTPWGGLCFLAAWAAIAVAAWPRA